MAEVRDMQRTAAYLLLYSLIGGLIVFAIATLAFGKSWSDAALDSTVLSVIYFCVGLRIRYRRRKS
jgi:hypothetical protein